VIESDFVHLGISWFSRLWAKAGQKPCAIVEGMRRGSDPMLPQREARNSKHPAIISNASAGHSKRKLRAISDDAYARDPDPVLVENSAGDGPHAVQPEFSEKSRIAGDLHRRAVAIGTALAMSRGQEALALCLKEIQAIGNACELKLTGAAGAHLEGLGLRARAGDRLEVDDGAGEWLSGSPIERNALNDAGPQAEDKAEAENEKAHSGSLRE
jgi:hypothetical protein